MSSTPLLQDWLGDDQPKRLRREIHFPTGRFGEAIEQAHAVVFLASDESSFVNGTDFVVDGGMSRVRYSISVCFSPVNQTRPRHTLLLRDRQPRRPRALLLETNSREHNVSIPQLEISAIGDNDVIYEP